MQANSTIGDEVILQQTALARNYAATNEQAQELIAAALDLSAATGQSLDTSVRNLGKSLSGLLGELGEAVPITRSLTQEQLKAGGAIKLLSERFAGAALAQTRTFSGALAQLSNTFGDFLEKLGSAITESPTVVRFFNALSTTISQLTSTITTTGPTFEQFFENLVIRVLAFAAAGNKVAAAFSQSFAFARFVVVALSQSLERLILNIEILKGFGAQGINSFLGLDDAASADAQRIELLRDRLKELDDDLTKITGSGARAAAPFEAINAQLNTLIDNFFALKFADPATAVADQFNGTVKAVEEGRQKLTDQIRSLQTDLFRATTDTFINRDDVLFGLQDLYASTELLTNTQLERLIGRLTTTRDRFKALSKQIGQAFSNGVASTITRGTQAAVLALRAGENAFSAFGKAALATIGDIAIQIGQTLILSGIGIESLKVLGGAAAIAAGLGLVAIGTLIKAAAGDAGGSFAPGSSTAPPLANVDGDGTDTTSDLNGPNQTAQVIIQGDVFDTEETGLRIADILKDQGFNNAVIA